VDTSENAEIQAIMADLREEISRYQRALGEAHAELRPDPLAEARQRSWVNPHLPIGWPVMPKGLIARLITYAQKITRRLLRWYINPIVEQQNTFNAAVVEALAALQNQVNALQEALTQQVQRLAERVQQTYAQREQSWVEQLEMLRGAQDAERQQRAHQDEMVRMRLQRLENWWRGLEVGASAPPATQSEAAQQAPPVDYMLLGAQYRSAATLREHLGEYDDLFADLLRAQREGRAPARPLLDIGCGRGDFVAHLRELGLDAYGIDIDRDALQIGQAVGHPIRQAEAFAHLESLEDDSLAGITLIQVIEHLDYGDILRLFTLAERKLAPGGLILAETINPACLVALSQWYLLDPSHRTPLHPEMTRFLLEQAGFWKVQTRYLHPVPPGNQLQALPDQPENAALADLIRRSNRNLEQLNQFLYGPQDYAAVACKPEE
jgi:2-polyprenyl-3-methyl-5-hydroxy-6-metoxy-1,4-benzoquinol methylase